MVVIWGGDADNLQFSDIKGDVCLYCWFFYSSLCIHLGTHALFMLWHCFPLQVFPAHWGYCCDLSYVALWTTHHFVGRGDSVPVEQICTVRCNMTLWEGGLRVGQAAAIGSVCPLALGGCAFSTLPKRKGGLSGCVQPFVPHSQLANSTVTLAKELKSRTEEVKQDFLTR